MENGLTEEEMLRVIASQIARNQCSYESKSEEEKKELFPKIEMVADSQVNELRKNFNSILNSVGVEIVPELKLELLGKIKDRVKEEGISSFSNVFASEEMINYISSEAIMVDQRLQEIVELDGEALSTAAATGTIVMLSDNKAENEKMETKKIEFKTTKKWTMPNGLVINYVEPKDGRFACTEDQAIEDMEILNHENDLDIVFDSFKNNPEDYDKCMEYIDLIVGLHNGRDAALRYIENELDENGIEFLTQNNLGKGLFERMSTLLKHDRETGTGIEDDNYTIFNKLKLFSVINEEYKKGNITDSDFKDFEEQMKDMDPELYEIFQKNPALLEVIQKDLFDSKDVNTNDSNNLAIKFAGKSESLARGETLMALNEYARKNPECQKEPTGNVPQPVGEEIIIEPPTKKTYIPPANTIKSPREVIEHNKGMMLRCYNEKGIETVLKALSKNSTAEQLSLKARTAWLESIAELFDPEKVGTEESIIRTEEDWSVVKEHLKNICDNENAYMYVQKLGAAVKNVSDSEKEKKVFSVGTVEEIVERFSEDQNKFNGEQETDRGEGR